MAPRNSMRGSYGVLRWGWCPAAVPGSYVICGSAPSAGAVIFFLPEIGIFCYMGADKKLEVWGRKALGLTTT